MKLPTEDELEELPSRAIVCYAARSALRVEPLFEKLFTEAEAEDIQAVKQANQVAAAYAAASGADIAATRAHAAAAAAAGARAAYAAVRAARAARAAGAAARAAGLAAAAADAAVRVAFQAGVAAAEAVAEADAVGAARAAYAAARRDYALLIDLAAARAQDKDPKFPVDDPALGPLWPEGEPDWDVHHASVARDKTATPYRDRPELELWIDPGHAEQEDLVELFSALSDLHRAYGGNGLIFTRDEQQSPVILENA